MDAIYNNLISTYPYTKKSGSKSRMVHGDDELKEHYNEIVSYNKKAPVYIVRLNEDNQEYILDLKDRSLQVMNEIKEYYGSMEDNYSKKQAVTDSYKVDASIVSENYDNLPGEFDIEVKQLASTQENRGKELYEDGKGLSPGNYSFEVNVSDRRYTLKYTIARNSKNIDVMNDISRMINRSNIGINASVEHSEDDKAYLKLESEDTGGYGEDIFIFKDKPTDDAGDGTTNGIVNYYGLNQVSRKAKSLVFDLDGQEKSFMTNDLVLNQSLELNIRGIDGEKVHIGYVSDGKQSFEAMQRIIDSYNSVVSADEKYRNKTGESTRLVKEFELLYEKNASELREVGITRNDDGYLQFDVNDATEAYSRGRFQEIFSKDSSFLNGLLNKNKTISLNPVEYTRKLMVSYPDYSKEGVGNSYMTSIFSGMLFNYYC